MEAFTAEELAEIVRELGLPAEIEIDDDQEVSISVVLDDLYWSIDLDFGRQAQFAHDFGKFFGSECFHGFSPFVSS